jgi:TPP-dependent pyruvate/acetoin dehydrogenase alpha subunit
VEPWRKRDPLLRLGLFLRKEGSLPEEAADDLLEGVREEVRGAIRVAESRAPRPEGESLFQDVYAEPLWQQREQLAELRVRLGE